MMFKPEVIKQKKGENRRSENSRNTRCYHKTTKKCQGETITQRVISWVSSWRLSPNLSKTKIRLFPSQPNVPPLLHPTFPQPIDIVSSHKHLGIFIDSNLSWEPHIDYICKRSSSSLGILSSHCYHLPISCKLLFYSAYLRPIFDYADTAWAGISTTRAAKLEIQHKKVLKILLRKPRMLPSSTLYALCLRDVIHILSPLSILSNSICINLTSTVSTGSLPVARETPFSFRNLSPPFYFTLPFLLRTLRGWHFPKKLRTFFPPPF